MRLICVSGPIAVGKSVLIGQLVDRFRAVRVSTRELIQSLRNVPSKRGPLQDAGDSLDAETDGAWVAQCLAAREGTFPDDAIVVVDSIRIAKQIDHLRRAFGDKVVHVHLTASYDVLAGRFLQRKEQGDPAVLEFETYDEARTNATEAAVEKLGQAADITLNTDKLTPFELLDLAAQHLGLSSNASG